jgi:uncharacterized membrane protein YhaH (DUF805 family)
MKCGDTQHMIAEMPKPDVNKVHPTTQINWNMITRLLFFLTVNLSVTNLLVKRIHDCESVGVSVAGTIVFLLSKEMRSGTTMEVCIKENKIDCVWLDILDMNETEGDQRATNARQSETARNH